MKALASFAAGVALCAASLTGTGRPAPAAAPCLYYAETPTGTSVWLGLEDAQQALRDLGIDPYAVPAGYDVTSRAGC